MTPEMQAAAIKMFEQLIADVREGRVVNFTSSWTRPVGFVYEQSTWGRPVATVPFPESTLTMTVTTKTQLLPEDARNLPLVGKWSY